MKFRSGSVVKIKPLGDKLGVVIGGQLSSRRRLVLYLVRYEIDNPVINRRSESSLYLERELERVV